MAACFVLCWVSLSHKELSAAWDAGCQQVHPLSHHQVYLWLPGQSVPLNEHVYVLKMVKYSVAAQQMRSHVSVRKLGYT